MAQGSVGTIPLRPCSGVAYGPETLRVINKASRPRPVSPSAAVVRATTPFFDGPNSARVMPINAPMIISSPGTLSGGLRDEPRVDGLLGEVMRDGALWEVIRAVQREGEKPPPSTTSAPVLISPGKQNT